MMACVYDVDIATTRKTTTRITMTMRRRVLTKRSKAATIAPKTRYGGRNRIKEMSPSYDLVAHEELQLYKHVLQYSNQLEPSGTLGNFLSSSPDPDIIRENHEKPLEEGLTIFTSKSSSNRAKCFIRYMF